MGNHRDPGPQPPASGSRAGLLVSTSECRGEEREKAGEGELAERHRENEAGVHAEGPGAVAWPLLKGHHHEEGSAPKLHDCVSL